MRKKRQEYFYRVGAVLVLFVGCVSLFSEIETVDNNLPQRQRQIG